MRRQLLEYSRRSAPAVQAALVSAGLALSALVLFSAPASAASMGILVKAGTAHGGHLPPIMTFRDGTSVDTWPVAAYARTQVADDSVILIHELASGPTREAHAAVAGLAVFGIEGGSASLLGELLDEAGAVVLFASPLTGAADPLLAERFEVLYANGASTAYVPQPLLTADVPEPGLAAGFGAGLSLLVALSRRRRVRVGREVVR